MKKFLSFILALTISLGMFSGLTVLSAPEAKAWTVDQENIVKRADYMYNATWVCQKNVAGWGDTFTKGKTYHVPYGQPIYAGSYVGYKNTNTLDDSSIDTYLAAAADSTSLFYTSRSHCGGTTAPYYATDCSAFVSWCWGIDRKTTVYIPTVSTSIGKANATNIQKLQIGDALNSSSHVILVTDLVYDATGAITQIEITEQTPPQLKRTNYTPAELAAKYKSSYTIYRYSGTVPNAPGDDAFTGNAPIFSLDVVKGETSSMYLSGWAFDTDDYNCSLDIKVSIGGTIDSADAEIHTFKANKSRLDVNAVYGCGDYHGFSETITTAKSGTQEVYVYVADNSVAEKYFLMGTQTVTIEADTQIPEISDIQVISYTPTSYTIQCKVSDNVGVTNCIFPTWHAENPDNKIWYQGTIENGFATCTIFHSDFGSAQGEYITHIYAYDAAGNSLGVAFSTTSYQPYGSFDYIDQNDGTINITGWAFDYDAPDEPLEVHVYIGGEAGNPNASGYKITADVYRADVNTVYGCGDYHGFATSIKTTLVGTQEVHLYLINKGNGSNIYLGSKTVTIPEDTTPPSITNINTTPIDDKRFTISCDATDNRGMKEVSFEVWSEDHPENKKTIAGTLFADTASCEVSTADFNNYQGTYYVAITAQDINGYSTTKQHITTFYQPQGFVEVSATDDYNLKITGWAFDRDTSSEPVDILVYIGGDKNSSNAECHTIKADGNSPDTAQYGCGTNHGIDALIENISNDDLLVYVYAKNTGNGADVLLSSSIVDFPEDTSAPAISHLKIVSSDAKGFNISCEISDNRAVAQVIFEIWTENNPADKKAVYGTIDGDTASCHVSIADFDSYQGNYYICATVSDYAENKTEKQLLHNFITPDFIYGDADGSGDVTISDVTYIQKILAGIEEEGENTLFLADVNRNGEIDIRDATNIQLFLTKNIDFLPVIE